MYVWYFVTASKSLDRLMSRDKLRVSVNNQECHFHLLAPARPFEMVPSSVSSSG